MDTYTRHPIENQIVINPQTMHGDHYDENPKLDNVRITGTYLHGELQERAGFDIFSFVDSAPKHAGIYPAKVLCLSDNATLFLWKDDDHGNVHGLVVDNEDEEGYNYALKCYSGKVYAL